MIAIRGYYENNRIRLLEPVPDIVKTPNNARVVVLFLDTFDAASTAISHQFKDWADDRDSHEQAALMQTIREELAPYAIQAMEAAADVEEDWEVILG